MPLPCVDCGDSRAVGWWTDFSDVLSFFDFFVSQSTFDGGVCAHFAAAGDETTGGRERPSAPSPSGATDYAGNDDPPCETGQEEYSEAYHVH